MKSVQKDGVEMTIEIKLEKKFTKEEIDKLRKAAQAINEGLRVAGEAITMAAKEMAKIGPMFVEMGYDLKKLQDRNKCYGGKPCKCLKCEAEGTIRTFHSIQEGLHHIEKDHFISAWKKGARELLEPIPKESGFPYR